MTTKAVKTTRTKTATKTTKVASADLKTMRGRTQTVRMDEETWTALQYARIERGMSQNDIMLAALRKDLGLK